MAKISKSFRLSEQAQDALRRLTALTGSSETAIVEMSLIFFSNQAAPMVKKSSEPAIPEPPPNFIDHQQGNKQAPKTGKDKYLENKNNKRR